MNDPSENVESSLDILNAIGGSDSEKTDFLKHELGRWFKRQIQKVRDATEEKTGDPEAYQIHRVVIGQELAGIITSVEPDFDGGVVAPLADIPIGFSNNGPIECQVLVSKKDRVLVLHYKYRSENNSGRGSIESTAPDLMDDETELEFYLENQ